MRGSGRWSSVVLCLVLLAGCERDDEAGRVAPGGGPVERTAPRREGTGADGFVVARTEDDQHDYPEWETYVRENRLLQGYAEVLNGWIALPEEVALTFAGCGEANAFFDEEIRAVVMCYELLDALSGVFADLPEPDRQQALMGATDFIFYHEVGHALIDVLDLPALGREEDVADQLAAYILTDGTPEGEQAAIDGAVALYRIGPNTGEVAFADEHSLGPQRFYNIACWVYGQSPDRFASLVRDGVLPEARAERCPDEYAQLERSWGRLLGPHLRP